MKTKARERNYGSRVDFILAGSGCRGDSAAALAPDQAEVRHACLQDDPAQAGTREKTIANNL
jgi:hypothetical protein